MDEINVRLRRGRDRSYVVAITDHVIDTLPAILERSFPGRSVYVITDANVRKLYGKRLLAALAKAGLYAPILEVPAGEASKNADLVFQIQTELLRRGVHRDSVIVALGGGVIGDLAGFVAATLLRGIDFVQVPTTLLAQVDSSVGGKVGIDHPVGKNLIGAFHQPRAVLIDAMFLRTLPERQFRSGLSEAIKIAAALDAGFFRYMAKHAPDISRTNQPLMKSIIVRSVGIKASVVMRDEFETGVRKALNLGHTIAHALEASSGFSILHGEAVSIGMIAESTLSVHLGLMSPRDQATMLRTLRALKLQTKLPAINDHAAFMGAMRADKKTVRGTVRFVLPAAIGKCAIEVEVPDAVIERLIFQRA